MDVSIIEESTAPDPETAVCYAARNDYYAGNIMDDTFEEVMEGIEAAESPDLSEKKTTLLHHLLRSEHYGPFEHPSITFHIEGMSRVTMAQITRHRHMSFDIQSMRYVDFEDADYAVPKSLTDAEHFSRETGLVDVAPEDQQVFEARYHEVTEQALDLYTTMVEHGIPKEDARYVLPLSMKVNVVMSGNLRTMLHVMNMRGKADAQWEIRQLTEGIVNLLDDWAPITTEYFESHGPFKLGM